MKIFSKLLTTLTLIPLVITPVNLMTSCGQGEQEVDQTKCTITIDSNGGWFDDESISKTTIVDKTKSYSQIKETLPKPIRKFHKFLGYSKDGMNIIQDWYQFTKSNDKLYALWEKEEAVSVSFDANGGTFGGTINKKMQLLTSGTLLKDVQINNPTYTGRTFNGWTIDEKVALDESYALTSNITLKAIWLNEQSMATITVDKNYETPSQTDTIQIPIGTLFKNIGFSPYSRENYTQRCFGDSTTGLQLTNNTIVSGDMNIKVWWKSNGTSEESTPAEYIYNRSFSISNNEASGVGTCWIISDATPGNLVDYQYYIATNLHVRVGLETETVTNYTFTDSKAALQPGTGYTNYVSFTWEDKTNFTYDKENPLLNSIDISVAKADFSNATGSTKDKLDNLNKRQGVEGCITEVVDSVSQNEHYEALSNLTTCGYGAINTTTNDYQWEEHALSSIGLEYFYDAFSKSHSTNDPVYGMDVSPQYELKGEEVDWMRPGSSGSMLVAKDTDNTWKVLGIYWGGESEDPEGTKGHLMFSCFNSDKANFLSKYNTYNKQ